MNFDNLPQDAEGQRFALKVEALALAELLVKFKGDSSVSSFVTGTIHNEIELIDKCLEFGVDYVKSEQYATDAKADNLTEEQFPNV